MSIYSYEHTLICITYLTHTYHLSLTTRQSNLSNSPNLLGNQLT